MNSRSTYDPVDPEEVPTITDLIKRHRDQTGDTYRQMAERAEKAGVKIKYQTIADLAKDGPKGWPKQPDTITALSVALRTSERAIVLAFARSFGLDIGAERPVIDAALYPTEKHEGWDLLPKASRDELMGILKDYVDDRLAEIQRPATEQEGGGRGGDSAATKQEVTLAARGGEANLKEARRSPVGEENQDPGGEGDDVS